MPARDLTFRFLGVDAGAGREFDRMAGKAEHTHSIVNKFALGLATAGVGVAAVSVKMAVDFESSQNRLQSAVKNSRKSWDALKPSIDTADKRLEALGFTAAQTDDALATLTNATRNPAKALGDMGLAADIARGRNISLSDATMLLTKVETGHVALLGRLGINVKDATGKTISQTEALKRLAAVYSGDAARATQTLTGKQEVLKAQLEDVGVKVGDDLLPILSKLVTFTSKDLVPELDKVGGFAKRNSEWLKPLAEGVAGLAVAYKALKIAAGIKGTLTGVGLLGRGSKIASELGVQKVFVVNLPGGGLVPGLPGTGGVPLPKGKVAGPVTRIIKSLPIIGTIAVAADEASNYTQGQNRASQRRLTATATSGPAGLAAVEAARAKLLTMKKMVGDPEGVTTALLKQIDTALRAAGVDATTLNTALSRTVKGGQSSANVIVRMGPAQLAAARATATHTEQIQRQWRELELAPHYVGLAEAAALAGGKVIGRNISVGMAQGIDKGFQTHVLRAVTTLADGSIKVVSTKFQLGSPSKLMHQYGQWVTEGLAGGIQSRQGHLERVMGNVTGAAIRRTGGGTAGPAFSTGERETTSSWSHSQARWHPADMQTFATLLSRQVVAAFDMALRGAMVHTDRNFGIAVLGAP